MSDVEPIVDSILARLFPEGLDGYEVYTTCSMGAPTLRISTLNIAGPDA